MPTISPKTIENTIHSPQRSYVNALPIVGVVAGGDHQRGLVDADAHRGADDEPDDPEDRLQRRPS